MNQAMMLTDHAPQMLTPARTGRKRNLGGAVMLAAIQDYRSLNHKAHQDAASFLYPETAGYQQHFARVAAMGDGMNVTWLRDALDRRRAQWDRERQRRQSRRQL